MKEGNQDMELSKTDGSHKNSHRSPDSEASVNVTDDPEVPPRAEILDRMPADARKVVEIGMSMHRFPAPHPLTDKLNEKHIDKILELSAESEKRSFDETAQSRRFNLIYAVILAALFIFVTIFLVQADRDLYKEILKLFAVFLGGFGGGFGVKTYMDRGKGM